MSDNWNVYFTEVEGRPATIMVDLGLAPGGPQADRPFLFRLKLQVLKPTPDGFPSNEENATLHALEDKLESIVCKALDAVYVGRITCDGSRDFFYYHNAEARIPALMSELAALLKRRGFEADGGREDGWEGYFDFLYPSAIEYQVMMNESVLNNLMEHGDDLQTARPINHFVYFLTPAARDAFVRDAARKGYALERNLDATKDSPRPGALLVHTAPATHDVLREATIDLFQLAEKHDGEYDGFETVVVKPSTAKPKKPTSGKKASVKPIRKPLPRKK